MFTPQQIQEISFETVRKGGYDMDSVDNVLEPLTQDYLTLYKENSVLKSKLRILVEKLEEYRRQENTMQSAILAAQKTGDQMLAETEKKCAAMLREAEQKASSRANNYDVKIEAEEERLMAAKEASRQFLDGMEKRLKRQLELIDEIRKIELPEEEPIGDWPVELPKERRAFDFNEAPTEASTQEKADALIEEIGLHIEEKLSAGALGESGNAETEKQTPPEDKQFKVTVLHSDVRPAPPKKFEDLQFGKNYQPGEKK